MTLRSLRLAHGASVEDLARGAAITPDRLLAYEGAHAVPHPRTLVRLAAALGIPDANLLRLRRAAIAQDRRADIARRWSGIPGGNRHSHEFHTALATIKVGLTVLARDGLDTSTKRAVADDLRDAIRSLEVGGVVEIGE